jgi:hypothetical protein
MSQINETKFNATKQDKGMTYWIMNITNVKGDDLQPSMFCVGH